MEVGFAEADGVDSAGAGSWKAPSRDLDGSAVSAWPVVGPGAPLVWDTYPPAGKDQKPSWGFGGKAPDFSALGAAGSPAESGGLSLLDYIKNNRHTPAVDLRPEGRGKWCGRWSVRGLNPVNGRMCTRRMNCKGWTCPYCGPRRAKKARAAIKYNAEALGLRYFWTLTLDKRNLARGASAVKQIRKSFNKFREYLKRKFGVVPFFICVVEFTQAGTPHLHVLFDRYIPHAWVSSKWDRLGGGKIVFVKPVTIQKVARYLSKYFTKELLLSAPKGTRRITCSRAIKLFPKWVGQHTVQEVLRQSVWSLLSEQRVTRAFTEKRPNLLHGFTLGIEMDEENFLQAFELIEHDFSGRSD